MQEAEDQANAFPGSGSAKERIERLKSELEGCRGEMEREAKRASKLEGKV